MGSILDKIREREDEEKKMQLDKNLVYNNLAKKLPKPSEEIKEYIKEEFNKIPKKEGVKFDSEKCPLHLIPRNAIEGTAWVFGCGAQKYASWNYTNGMAWSKMLRAAESHIAELFKGNMYDEEFGTHHVYHAICSLMMLAENMMLHPDKNDLYPEIYVEKKDQVKEFMDREKKAALSYIANKLNEKKNVSK